MSAPARWVTGATSRATGSTDITKPPVAENHRNATSRQRALSRSQRTGRVTRLVPVVSAYSDGDLLAEQVAADPPVHGGQCRGGRDDGERDREADGDQPERDAEDRQDRQRERRGHASSA